MQKIKQNIFSPAWSSKIAYQQAPYLHSEELAQMCVYSPVTQFKYFLASVSIFKFGKKQHHIHL